MDRGGNQQTLVNMENNSDTWVRKAETRGKSGLLVFWLWIFLPLFGLTAPCRSEIVDSVVAVVNGEPITLSMVADEMNSIWTETQDTPRSQQAALQKLIDHKLELQEARRLGTGVIVSEDRLSREVLKVVSRFTPSKEPFEVLKQRGISQEDLAERLIEEIMVQEMVNRKFRLFVEITDIEASAFFEQRKESFVVAETVSLDQIFFQLTLSDDESTREAVKKEAEEVLEKLKGGDSFSKYTTEEGIVDYVTVNQLIPVVAAVVSRIEIGEISELIETPAGYFIIKLNNRRPGRQATFNDVKAEIKELLLQQKTDNELNAWLKKQREMADIRVIMELEG